MLGITKRQDTRVNAMQPDGVILSGHLQPLYPVDHKRRRTKTTAPWALGLVLAFTIAALWGTMIYQTHTAPDTVITQLGWTVTAGVASFCVAIWVLCSVKIGEVRRYNEQVRSEDESHVVHQRGMENKHMDQRVPAMNAAKDIQVATIGGRPACKVPRFRQTPKSKWRCISPKPPSRRRDTRRWLLNKPSCSSCRSSFSISSYVRMSGNGTGWMTSFTGSAN